jgi:hypothetical protein
MRNHLIPYEMQTDQFRSHSDVEMALHGVPYPLVKLGNGLRLGEDRFSDSSGQVPLLGGVLDDKNDLGHHFAPTIVTMSGKAAHRIVRNPQALPSDPINPQLSVWKTRMAALDIVQKIRPPRWK